MSRLPNPPLDIAIVGLSGCYAGAPDVRRYWQNILDKVDSVTAANAEWTGPYLDVENYASRNDRTYTNRGGFLHDLAHIDPIEYGVMPSQSDGGEPDHLLALKHAGDALADAGYRQRSFDRERTGVILGRGTYTNRGQTNALYHAFFMDQMLAVIGDLRPDMSAADLDQLRAGLKKQLPPYSGELVGQLTPNVITGLIANRLDLMGPNYIVDAACASSLIAFDHAVQQLASKRCDMMLVGGVHAHTPAQLYVQFSQINALSRGQLRPFQKGHSGTLLGEGVGVMVLKRLADAERDGDRIYAVAKGVGVASDGRAKGLLTPRPEGELLAMRRAYESCGIDPATIDLVEAHGTGTDIGDLTEIETLAQIFSGRGVGPQIAVGSVKSMIGHCLPASGSASLIKTVLALHHKILPPTLCDEPDPALGLEKTPLYINSETRPWIHGKRHPRRAGVNAFGFGGINAHVILEEYVPGIGEVRRTQVSVLHRPTPSELVTLAAESRDELIALANAALLAVRTQPPASLSQIARASSAHAHGEHRLGIVADNESDLAKKLEQAIDKLGRADAKPFKTRSGLFYGSGQPAGKVCFVYPGEGAQYSGMLADLCLHFPAVRDWFDFLDATADRNGSEPRAPILFPPSSGLDTAAREVLESRLFEVDIAAESVFAASMGLHTLIESLGIKPDAMLGHSTGENTAIVACGVRRFAQREQIAESIRELNVIFAALEAAGRIVHGTLLSIGALRPELREELLAGSGTMQVAMDNCPNQLVMFGSPADAQLLKRRLSNEGAICQELPFGRAYHTPLFRPMADAYRDYLAPFEFGPGSTTLYSARSVAPFPQEPDAIRELAAQQWENPVRFTDTVKRLYDDGFRVFVEVGPSGNLTSFIGDILRGRDDVLALSSNSRRKSGVQQLHQILAQLFTTGVAIDTAALYQHRDIAALNLMHPVAAPKRRGFALKLQMPQVKVTDELRQRFAPKAAVTPISSLAVATEASSVRDVPIAPAQAAAATDPRLAVLQAHFSLMQDFLSSQARVLGGLGSAQAVENRGQGPLLQVSDQGTVEADLVRDYPISQGADLVRDDGSRATLPATHRASFPLLGEVTERSADRLVALRRFDTEQDIFLHDHAIGGAPSRRQPGLRGLMVVPFTFSMELVAQVALALVDAPLAAPMLVAGMSELRGHRWLALDEGFIDLRSVAERQPDIADNVHVRVRVFLLSQPGQGKTGPVGGTLVFEGHVELARARPIAPAPMVWPSPVEHPPVFSQPHRLYGEGMFHGPKLQGVKRVRRWSPDAIEADLLVLPTDEFFAGLPQPRFLTEAAVLDAIGQLAGYWLFEQFGSKFYCFPFRAGRYTQYADVLPAGTPLICRGSLKLLGDVRMTAQFDLLDTQGRLLLRLDEWEDRVFEIPQVYHRFHRFPVDEFVSEAAPSPLPGVLLRRVPAFPEHFFDSGYEIWKRVLAYASLGERERAVYRALPNAPHRREEWLLGRIAAKDAVRLWAREQRRIDLAPADIEILSNEEGIPVVHCAWLAGAVPSVSITHSQREIAVVLAEPGSGVGVDLQFHAQVRADDLISIALIPEEAQAVLAAPEPDRVRLASAFWCAKEAAAKALGRGLGGRPQQFRAVAWQLDRRGGPTFAEIVNGNDRVHVELFFEEHATLAVCHIAAAASVATAATLNSPSLEIA